MIINKQNTKDNEIYLRDFDENPWMDIESVGSHSYPDISSELHNETYGRKPERTFLDEEVLRIVEPVLKQIQTVENKAISEQVNYLFSITIALITEFKERNIDINQLPPLRAVNLPDGSMLIEWIFSSFRIGFSIEEEKEDSIWYLVSNMGNTDLSKSGDLVDISIENLIELITFGISYS